MPEMAKVLLDKCVTTEGSKDSRDYKIMYDFFCLEETGMSTDSAQGITRHTLFSIRMQSSNSFMLRSRMFRYLQIRPNYNLTGNMKE